MQDLAVYHAVWSRDLYQIATGLLAIGDSAAANRALDFLWTVQQRADGSFPQNSRLDGTPVFGDLQMDEVAFPIVLAHQLGRTGAADWEHVKRSADYVVANGPRTPQERWENADRLLAGDHRRRDRRAGLRGRHRDEERRHQRRRLPTWPRPTSGSSNVESLTATTTGPYSSSPYYLRITKNGHPDSGDTMQVSDGGPLIDERYVVDPSFLDLVRLGVKRADDPVVTNSVAVVDDKLGYQTANGQFWHRASFDGYGEQRDGSQWEPSDPGSGKTIGRGWPLLSGERGEYELLTKGGAASAAGRLDTMGRAADDASHLMAEQVWDHNPPAGTPGFTPGEPTLSATPLAWTHAQFLRLAASVDAGAPIETPQVVACRYGSEACTS